MKLNKASKNLIEWFMTAGKDLILVVKSSSSSSSFIHFNLKYGYFYND